MAAIPLSKYTNMATVTSHAGTLQKNIVTSTYCNGLTPVSVLWLNDRVYELVISKFMLSLPILPK